MSGIKIDVRLNVPRYDQQVSKALENITDDYTTVITRGMEVLAPVKSGMLKFQIGRQFTITKDRIFVTIRSGAPYTEIVEKGSRPHLIEAKNAKALRFVIGGVVRFAKSVQHPGTKPTFFIKRSVEAANRVLPVIIRKYMQEVGKIK